MDLKAEILAHLDIRALYHKELGELKNGRGDQALVGLCPFHKDTKASLSLNLKTGLWNCKSCSAKGDVFTFIRKKYDTDFKGALDILPQEAGIENARGNGRRRGKKESKAAPQIVKTYDYYDEDGVPVFQVCRTHPKGFFQRRPVGKGGWVNNLDGVVLVPYRLLEVLKAEMVLIPEGEKDCDTLVELGLTSTCNPQGAGKWRADYNKHFKDKRVVIIPDKDEPGRKHAPDVARHLHGIAATVKVVELPDLPEKGDISEWLKRGGTKEQLLALIESTSEWNSPADQEQHLVEGEALRTRAHLVNGSNIQILTASSKSVRGPHPQKLKLDEVDEMAPELYEAALLILKSAKGIRASVQIYSTMHKAYGLMNRVITEAAESGYRVYNGSSSLFLGDMVVNILIF